MKEILKRPYFKRFLVARFISNFGNGMGPIALAFGILHMEGGSAKLLGFILGIQTVTMLIMTPFGGVIADKYGRILILGLMDIVGGSALLVQAIYFGTGHVPMLVFILVNITFGISWGVFRPTFSGMMPALLSDEDLQKGNAAVQFVANSAMISGTAVGGILVSTIGSSLALGIDAVTFIVCGFIVFGLRHLSNASTKKSTILDDLVHGWKVFLSFPWIVAIVAAFSLIVMCWAAAENVLGPLIALQKFDGPKTWAIILTVETFGFVAGSLVGMKIKPKYPMRFLMIVTFSISIYIWTLAAPQPVWVIAGAAFFWGLSLDLWGAIWTTALQREVPREALSRVSAFDGLGSMIFSPVGLAIAAPMAEWIGITRTLEIFAVLSAVVIAATLAVPQVWKMQLTADS